MITIKKTLSLPFTYPVETIAPPEQVLFFDIETTGFSGDTSTLYLIGCLYRETAPGSLSSGSRTRWTRSAPASCTFLNLWKTSPRWCILTATGSTSPTS